MEPCQRSLTFQEFLLELMMILTFLTGAGVLDDIMDGLQTPWGSYVQNLVEIRWVWRHQEPCRRSMTFQVFLQELLLELMIIRYNPDWGWCHWWCFGLSRCTMRKLWLKSGGNLLSLKASRTLSKINDIAQVVAGDDDDYGHSWLGLVSLMMYWIVSICSEEAMFKILWKSNEFEGIKSFFKDQ